MFGIDRKPVGLELWILKWVFILLCLLALVVAWLGDREGRNRCEALCAEKHFASFRYTSPGRFGAHPERCTCLSESDLLQTDAVPKGTRVF